MVESCKEILEFVSEPVESRSGVLRLNKEAVAELTPEGKQDWCAIVAVVIPKQRLDCMGGLHCMIVRDSGEEMMDDVGISDVMKHLVQHAVVTVDGGERTTKPVPLVGVIVRERRVRVMEIRDDC